MNPMGVFEDARERHQALLSEASQERLAREGREPKDALLRQAARVVGRVFLRLGMQLLRYGRTMTPEVLLSYPAGRTTQTN